MIKINLLPKEIQEKGKGSEWVILGSILIGLFALAGMSSYFLKLQGYKKELAKKERWTKQLNEVKAKVEQVTQLDAEKTTLNAKKNTVLQLLQGRLYYPKLMETFYSTLPKDVWVTDVTLSGDPQKNIKIEANSNALTTEAIAEWLEILGAKPEKFSGIALSPIEKVPPANPKEFPTFKFKMTFSYSPPPAGA